MTLQVNIIATGRMSLPAGIRKRWAFKAAARSYSRKGVVLRTVTQAVAREQAIAKKNASHPDASIDAFLANRRVDSGE